MNKYIVIGLFIGTLIGYSVGFADVQYCIGFIAFPFAYWLGENMTKLAQSL